MKARLNVTSEKGASGAQCALDWRSTRSDRRRTLPGGAEEGSEGLLQSSTPLDRQETAIDSDREAEVVWRK